MQNIITWSVVASRVIHRRLLRNLISDNAIVVQGSILIDVLRSYLSDDVFVPDWQNVCYEVYCWMILINVRLFISSGHCI